MIIDSFINPKIVGDGGIPRKILLNAKVGVFFFLFPQSLTMWRLTILGADYLHRISSRFHG